MESIVAKIQSFDASVVSDPQLREEKTEIREKTLLALANEELPLPLRQKIAEMALKQLREGVALPAMDLQSRILIGFSQDDFEKDATSSNISIMVENDDMLQNVYNCDYTLCKYAEYCKDFKYTEPIPFAEWYPLFMDGSDGFTGSLVRKFGIWAEQAFALPEKKTSAKRNAEKTPPSVLRQNKRSLNEIKTIVVGELQRTKPTEAQKKTLGRETSATASKRYENIHDMFKCIKEIVKEKTHCRLAYYRKLYTEAVASRTKAFNLRRNAKELLEGAEKPKRCESDCIHCRAVDTASALMAENKRLLKTYDDNRAVLLAFLINNSTVDTVIKTTSRPEVHFEVWAAIKRLNNRRGVCRSQRRAYNRHARDYLTTGKVKECGSQLTNYFSMFSEPAEPKSLIEMINNHQTANVFSPQPSIDEDVETENYLDDTIVLHPMPKTFAPEKRDRKNGSDIKAKKHARTQRAEIEKIQEEAFWASVDRVAKIKTLPKALRLDAVRKMTVDQLKEYRAVNEKSKAALKQAVEKQRDASAYARAKELDAKIISGPRDVPLKEKTKELLKELELANPLHFRQTKEERQLEKEEKYEIRGKEILKRKIIFESKKAEHLAKKQANEEYLEKWRQAKEARRAQFEKVEAGRQAYKKKRLEAKQHAEKVLEKRKTEEQNGSDVTLKQRVIRTRLLDDTVKRVVPIRTDPATKIAITGIVVNSRTIVKEEGEQSSSDRITLLTHNTHRTDTTLKDRIESVKPVVQERRNRMKWKPAPDLLVANIPGSSRHNRKKFKDEYTAKDFIHRQDDPVREDLFSYIKNRDRHLHKCTSCGNMYSHVHGYNHKHGQFPNQCPYEGCPDYMGSQVVKEARKENRVAALTEEHLTEANATVLDVKLPSGWTNETFTNEGESYRYVRYLDNEIIPMHIASKLYNETQMNEFKESHHHYPDVFSKQLFAEPIGSIVIGDNDVKYPIADRHFLLYGEDPQQLHWQVCKAFKCNEIITSGTPIYNANDKSLCGVVTKSVVIDQNRYYGICGYYGARGTLMSRSHTNEKLTPGVWYAGIKFVGKEKLVDYIRSLDKSKCQLNPTTVIATNENTTRIYSVSCGFELSRNYMDYTMLNEEHSTSCEINCCYEYNQTTSVVATRCANGTLGGTGFEGNVTCTCSCSNHWSHLDSRCPKQAGPKRHILRCLYGGARRPENCWFNTEEQEQLQNALEREVDVCLAQKKSAYYKLNIHDLRNSVVKCFTKHGKGFFDREKTQVELAPGWINVEDRVYHLKGDLQCLHLVSKNKLDFLLRDDLSCFGADIYVHKSLSVGRIYNRIFVGKPQSNYNYIITEKMCVCRSEVNSNVVVLSRSFESNENFASGTPLFNEYGELVSCITVSDGVSCYAVQQVHDRRSAYQVFCNTKHNPNGKKKTKNSGNPNKAKIETKNTKQLTKEVGEKTTKLKKEINQLENQVSQLTKQLDKAHIAKSGKKTTKPKVNKKKPNKSGGGILSAVFSSTVTVIMLMFLILCPSGISAAITPTQLSDRAAIVKSEFGKLSSLEIKKMSKIVEIDSLVNRTCDLLAIKPGDTITAKVRDANEKLTTVLTQLQSLHKMSARTKRDNEALKHTVDDWISAAEVVMKKLDELTNDMSTRYREESQLLNRLRRDNPVQYQKSAEKLIQEAADNHKVLRKGLFSSLRDFLPAAEAASMSDENTNEKTIEAHADTVETEITDSKYWQIGGGNKDQFCSTISEADYKSPHFDCSKASSQYFLPLSCGGCRMGYSHLIDTSSGYALSTDDCKEKIRCDLACLSTDALYDLLEQQPKHYACVAPFMHLLSGTAPIKGKKQTSHSNKVYVDAKLIVFIDSEKNTYTANRIRQVPLRACGGKQLGDVFNTANTYVDGIYLCQTPMRKTIAENTYTVTWKPTQYLSMISVICTTLLLSRHFSITFTIASILLSGYVIHVKGNCTSELITTRINAVSEDRDVQLFNVRIYAREKECLMLGTDRRLKIDRMTDTVVYNFKEATPAMTQLNCTKWNWNCPMTTNTVCGTDLGCLNTEFVRKFEHCMSVKIHWASQCAATGTGQVKVETSIQLPNEVIGYLYLFERQSKSLSQRIEVIEELLGDTVVSTKHTITTGHKKTETGTELEFLNAQLENSAQYKYVVKFADKYFCSHTIPTIDLCVSRNFLQPWKLVDYNCLRPSVMWSDTEPIIDRYILTGNQLLDSAFVQCPPEIIEILSVGQALHLSYSSTNGYLEFNAKTRVVQVEHQMCKKIEDIKISVSEGRSDYYLTSLITVTGQVDNVCKTTVDLSPCIVQGNPTYTINTNFEIKIRVLCGVTTPSNIKFKIAGGMQLENLTHTLIVDMNYALYSLYERSRVVVASVNTTSWLNFLSGITSPFSLIWNLNYIVYVVKIAAAIGVAYVLINAMIVGNYILALLVVAASSVAYQNTPRVFAYDVGTTHRIFSTSVYQLIYIFATDLGFEDRLSAALFIDDIIDVLCLLGFACYGYFVCCSVLKLLIALYLTLVSLTRDPLSSLINAWYHPRSVELVDTARVRYVSWLSAACVPTLENTNRTVDHYDDAYDVIYRGSKHIYTGETRISTAFIRQVASLQKEVEVQYREKGVFFTIIKFRDGWVAMGSLHTIMDLRDVYHFVDGDFYAFWDDKKFSESAIQLVAQHIIVTPVDHEAIQDAVIIVPYQECSDGEIYELKLFVDIYPDRDEIVIKSVDGKTITDVTGLSGLMTKHKKGLRIQTMAKALAKNICPLTHAPLFQYVFEERNNLAVLKNNQTPIYLCSYPPCENAMPLHGNNNIGVNVDRNLLQFNTFVCFNAQKRLVGTDLLMLKMHKPSFVRGEYVMFDWLYLGDFEYEEGDFIVNKIDNNVILANGKYWYNVGTAPINGIIHRAYDCNFAVVRSDQNIIQVFDESFCEGISNLGDTPGPQNNCSLRFSLTAGNDPITRVAVKEGPTRAEDVIFSNSEIISDDDEVMIKFMFYLNCTARMSFIYEDEDLFKRHQDIIGRINTVVPVVVVDHSIFHLYVGENNFSDSARMLIYQVEQTFTDVRWPANADAWSRVYSAENVEKEEGAMVCSSVCTKAQDVDLTCRPTFMAENRFFTAMVTTGTSLGRVFGRGATLMTNNHVVQKGRIAFTKSVNGVPHRETIIWENPVRDIHCDIANFNDFQLADPITGNLYCVIDLIQEKKLWVVCKQASGRIGQSAVSSIFTPVTVDFTANSIKYKKWDCKKGLSGSPIIDESGNVVAVYGKSRRAHIQGKSRYVTVSAPTNSHIKNLEYFTSCAQQIIDSDIPSNKNYFLLEAPTGVGKTRILPVILMEKLENNSTIIVLEPRVAAAENAFHSISSFVAERGMQEQIQVKMQIGVRNVDSSKSRGSGSKIILVMTNGKYNVDENTLRKNANYVILDEAHIRDDPTILTTQVTSLCEKRVARKKGESGRLVYITATDCGFRDLGETVAGLTNISSTLHNIEDRPIQIKGNSDSSYIFIRLDNIKSCKQYWPKEIQIPREYFVSGNTIVFAPTKNAVDDIATQIERQFNFTVMRYFAGCGQDLQNLEDGTIIVSTDALGVSVTVPNVSTVVDLGLQLRPVADYSCDDVTATYRYDKTLQIQVITKQDAAQRRGRTGRNCPGVYLYFNTFNHKDQEMWPITTLTETLWQMLSEKDIGFDTNKLKLKLETCEDLSVKDLLIGMLKFTPDKLNIDRVKARIAFEVDNGDPIALTLLPVLWKEFEDYQIGTSDEALMRHHKNNAKENKKWFEDYKRTFDSTKIFSDYKLALDYMRKENKIVQSYGLDVPDRDWKNYEGIIFASSSQQAMLIAKRINKISKAKEQTGLGMVRPQQHKNKSIIPSLTFTSSSSGASPSKSGAYVPGSVTEETDEDDESAHPAAIGMIVAAGTALCVSGIATMLVDRNGVRYMTKVVHSSDMNLGGLAKRFDEMDEKYEKGLSFLEKTLEKIRLYIKKTWRKLVELWKGSEAVNEESETAITAAWLAFKAQCIANFPSVFCASGGVAAGCGALLGTAVDSIVGVFGPMMSSIALVISTTMVTAYLGVLPAVVTCFLSAVTYCVKTSASTITANQRVFNPYIGKAGGVLVGGSAVGIGLGMAYAEVIANMFTHTTVMVGRPVMGMPYNIPLHVSIQSNIVIAKHIYMLIAKGLTGRMGWAAVIAAVLETIGHVLVTGRMTTLYVIAGVALFAGLRSLITLYRSSVITQAANVRQGGGYTDLKDLLDIGGEWFDTFVGAIAMCANPTSIVVVTLRWVHSWYEDKLDSTEFRRIIEDWGGVSILNGIFIFAFEKLIDVVQAQNGQESLSLGMYVAWWVSSAPTIFSGWKKWIMKFLGVEKCEGEEEASSWTDEVKTIINKRFCNGVKKVAERIARQAEVVIIDPNTEESRKISLNKLALYKFHEYREDVGVKAELEITIKSLWNVVKEEHITADAPTQDQLDKIIADIYEWDRTRRQSGRVMGALKTFSKGIAWLFNKIKACILWLCKMIVTVVQSGVSAIKTAVFALGKLMGAGFVNGATRGMFCAEEITPAIDGLSSISSYIESYQRTTEADVSGTTSYVLRNPSSVNPWIGKLIEMCLGSETTHEPVRGWSKEFHTHFSGEIKYVKISTKIKHTCFRIRAADLCSLLSQYTCCTEENDILSIILPDGKKMTWVWRWTADYTEIQISLGNIYAYGYLASDASGNESGILATTGYAGTYMLRLVTSLKGIFSDTSLFDFSSDHSMNKKEPCILKNGLLHEHWDAIASKGFASAFKTVYSQVKQVGTGLQLKLAQVEKSTIRITSETFSLYQRLLTLNTFERSYAMAYYGEIVKSIMACDTIDEIIDRIRRKDYGPIKNRAESHMLIKVDEECLGEESEYRELFVGTKYFLTPSTGFEYAASNEIVEYEKLGTIYSGYDLADPDKELRLIEWCHSVGIYFFEHKASTYSVDSKFGLCSCRVLYDGITAKIATGLCHVLSTDLTLHNLDTYKTCIIKSISKWQKEFDESIGAQTTDEPATESATIFNVSPTPSKDEKPQNVLNERLVRVDTRTVEDSDTEEFFDSEGPRSYVRPYWDKSKSEKENMALIGKHAVNVYQFKLKEPEKYKLACEYTTDIKGLHPPEIPLRLLYATEAVLRKDPEHPRALEVLKRHYRYYGKKMMPYVTTLVKVMKECYIEHQDVWDIEVRDYDDMLNYYESEGLLDMVFRGLAWIVDGVVKCFRPDGSDEKRTAIAERLQTISLAPFGFHKNLAFSVEDEYEDASSIEPTGKIPYIVNFDDWTRAHPVTEWHSTLLTKSDIQRLESENVSQEEYTRAYEKANSNLAQLPNHLRETVKYKGRIKPPTSGGGETRGYTYVSKSATKWQLLYEQDPELFDHAVNILDPCCGAGGFGQFMLHLGDSKNQPRRKYFFNTLKQPGHAVPLIENVKTQPNNKTELVNLQNSTDTGDIRSNSTREKISAFGPYNLVLLDVGEGKTPSASAAWHVKSLPNPLREGRNLNYNRFVKWYKKQTLENTAIPTVVKHTVNNKSMTIVCGELPPKNQFYVDIMPTGLTPNPETSYALLSKAFAKFAYGVVDIRQFPVCNQNYVRWLRKMVAYCARENNVKIYSSDDLWRNTDDADVDWISNFDAQMAIIDDIEAGGNAVIRQNHVHQLSADVLTKIMSKFRQIYVWRSPSCPNNIGEFYYICKKKRETPCEIDPRKTLEILLPVRKALTEMYLDVSYCCGRPMSYKDRYFIKNDWFETTGQNATIKVTPSRSNLEPPSVSVKIPEYDIDVEWSANWAHRLRLIELKQQQRRPKFRISEQSRTWKSLYPLGSYNIGRAKYPEKLKHVTNEFIAEGLSRVFGVNTATASYGPTQCTKEYVDESYATRLDRDPGHLDARYLLDLTKALKLQRTDYGKELKEKKACRMLTAEEVLLLINNKGAVGKLDEWGTMKEWIDSTPDWYIRAVEERILPWSEGKDTESYLTSRVKLETKQRKDAEGDGKLKYNLGEVTSTELIENANMVARQITFADALTRIAHIILCGDLINKHAVNKTYQGSITGCPPHYQGRVIKTAWEYVEGKRSTCLIPERDMYIEEGSHKTSRSGSAAGVVIDFSKFDFTQTIEERVIQHQNMAEYYPEFEAKAIMGAGREMAFSITFNDFGDVWGKQGMRNSGEIWTSFGNTELAAAHMVVGLSRTLGISIEEVCNPTANMYYYIGGGAQDDIPDLGQVKEETSRSYPLLGEGRKHPYWKKFELTDIIRFVDGDDINVILEAKLARLFVAELDNVLKLGNKIVRSGDKSGPELVYEFEDLFFCSHHYRRVLIGNITETHASVVNPGAKEYFLQTRKNALIAGKLLGTLKQITAKFDSDNEAALEVTRGKLLSYLLLYPHIRIVRSFCVTGLALLGDGRVKLDPRRFEHFSRQETVVGALNSLYGVSDLSSISCVEYKEEVEGLKILQYNARLVGMKCPTKIQDIDLRCITWFKNTQLYVTRELGILALNPRLITIYYRTESIV